MSVLECVAEYVQRMLNSPDLSGMKALILDKETTGIVAMAMSQSEILEKQVFLVERIDVKTKGDMSHLKAVIFVRPTAENVAFITELLRKPTYSEFHIFFSNILKREHIRSLAEADSFELVRQVQEYYADYLPLNAHLFSLDEPLTRTLYDAHWSASEQRIYSRTVEGIVALLLSFKRKPVIRFQGGSVICKRVAEGVQRCIRESGDLFEFGSRSLVGSDAPLLLVLDRREDPVTPLLQQWTYEAMVHELMGIFHNRVDMRRVQGTRKDMKEIVLSPLQDSFFKSASLLNFGDLGNRVKQLVEEYQRKTKNERKIDTIEDMQRVVENYSEYMAESSLVSKHVSLVTELSRLVEQRHLMDVSALEQSLACESGHSEALQGVLDMLKNVAIRFDDKLRLVLLYALRYETQRSHIATFCALLRDQAADDQERDRVKLVRELLRFAGAKARSLDLYSNKDIFSKAQRFISSGLQGVENIYTQHQPLLARTIDSLRKSRLRTQDFPYAASGNDAKHSNREVMLFIVGGATYEEAAFIALLNRQSSDNRFVLGGTCIHNSTSFLHDLCKGSNRDYEIELQ